MSGYIDISQAGVALGQNSTKYVSLSSSAAGALTLQGATSSDPVRLSGLAPPTQAGDAVTKAHMETYIASAVGGMSVKEDCVVASVSQQGLALQNNTVKWDTVYARNTGLNRDGLRGIHRRDGRNEGCYKGWNRFHHGGEGEEAPKEDETHRQTVPQ